jgi:S1-C subfamily serine protease
MSREDERPGNIGYRWPTHRTRRALVTEVLTVLVVLFAAISITRAASTGSGTPQTPAVPASVTAKVEPGVVDVVSILGLQSAEAAGTGMVVTASGVVLTNNHVVNGATTVTVTDVGNGRSYSAVVVNSSGQVIGMDTAASNGYTFQAGSDEGFAIPINTARAIAAEIEAGKASSDLHVGPSAFVGVSVQDATSGTGAEVVGVFDGSPAQRAGLTAGDVINALNGQAVTSASELTDALRAFHPGDTIELGWTDSSGRPHVSAIRLVTGPAD